MSIRLTVQLPPAKVRRPLARPSSITSRVDRIEDDDGVVAMRSVEAASIQ